MFRTGLWTGVFLALIAQADAATAKAVPKGVVPAKTAAQPSEATNVTVAGRAAGASGVFESIRPIVFQLKVAVSADSAKASYGTAFAVSKDGLLATNYHVVMKAVLDETYKLFLSPASGSATEKGVPAIEAKVVAIDVINDLALVKVAREFPFAMDFRTEPAQVGMRIYSLGLPKDLTMTITEGNYNGEKNKSIYRTMITSSPLNPGMSGGPTVDDAGKLLGVNVSFMIGTNSIFFIIPGEYLGKLLENRSGKLYSTEINTPAEWRKVQLAQAVAAQDRLSEELLREPEKSITFAEWSFRFNTELTDCWQNKEKADGMKAHIAGLKCFVPFEFNLDENLSVGDYVVAVRHITPDDPAVALTPEEKSRIRGDGTDPLTRGAQESKEFYGKFCDRSTLVLPASGQFLGGWCLTPMREYPGLFNAQYILKTSDPSYKDALLLELKLRGFTAANIKKVIAAMTDRLSRATGVSTPSRAPERSGS